MNLYLKHFELNEPPFRITPTTEFFYGGGQRSEILHALQYAIEVGEGIMMVTGEVGSGKTMLLRTLSEKLPENIELVYIANPSLSGREMLYNICEELGLDIDISRPDALRRLQDYLIDRHSQGKRVVAFIDEAQAMPDESLEEIRLFSNLETSRNKLLQIVLFGQPELFDKLSRQNMRQLRERITVSLKLQPFGRDDIREYISTRLHAAGYHGGELFAKDACRLLAIVSQGLSRRINVLADKSMLSAFERSSDRVLYEDVKRAVKDAKFGRMRYRSENMRRISRQLTIGLSVLAILIIGIAISSRIETSAPPADNSISTITEVSEAAKDNIASNAPQNSQSSSANKTAVITQEDKTQNIQTATDPVIITTVVQKTIVKIVTVTTKLAAPTQPSPDEELRAVIAAARRGEKINGEELGIELVEITQANASEIRDNVATQSLTQGGSKIIRDAGLIDNEKWQWMPEDSYLRLRLNATQTWIQDAPDGYTARLLTVEQERSVFLERFLRYFADFYPLRNVMVYPTRIGDKDRFVVSYGIYRGRDDAKIYIDNMPSYFIGGRPFAQQISDSVSESAGYWQ